MSHMETLGVFSQPSYITLGDQYKDGNNQVGRELKKSTRQMLSSVPKKGRVGDGTSFDEFKPLFVGDPYVDPGTYDRQYQKEQRKKIKAGPFKPSSPPKRATGLGDTYGLIGKPFDYIPEGDSKKAARKDKMPEPRNFMTSPPKRGTYGYSGTLFSTLPGSLGGSREESKKAKKPKESTGRFISTSRPLEYFDPNVYSFDNSKLKKKDQSDKRRSKSAASQRSNRPPFLPSSPSKRGYQATLNKFPEYIPDEYDKFKIRTKQDAEKLKPKPIWRPTSPSKSMRTRSIIFGSTQ